jgi:hypothetical protein
MRDISSFVQCCVEWGSEAATSFQRPISSLLVAATTILRSIKQPSSLNLVNRYAAHSLVSFTTMNVSCQCGNVAFRTPLSAPLAVYICHCNECRHQSSSAFGCSAIFPRFNLPTSIETLLSCYTRSTDSGNTLDCYFCKHCGSRVLHSAREGNTVSVKGGCIEGLDWNGAVHIWTKRAVIQIPDGVEAWEGEPDEEELEKGPHVAELQHGG